jgi:tetratricopeptide (TPR) repeat protein
MHPFLAPCLLPLLLSHPSPLAASRAEGFLRRGDIEGAVSALREDIVRNPADLDVQELLIDTYLTLGLGASVERHYLDKATQNLGNADAWYLAGRAAITADGARRAYERALALRPDHARAFMGMAAVDRAQGQLDKARTAYRKALELDPGLAEAHVGLGATYLAEGRRDEALAVARKAIEAVPADPEAWLVAASLDPEHAVALLRAGSAAVPDEPRLHQALGRALLESGKASEAVRAYDAALALRPSVPEALLERELAVSMKAGNLDLKGAATLLRAREGAREAPGLALETVDGLIAEYPRCPMLHSARAHLLASMNRPSEAEAAFKRALSLAPGDPEALAGLGLLYLVRDRPTDALPLLVKAREARPRDASLAISVAMARARVESAAAGMKDLERAVRDFPGDPRPVVSLATLMARAGDREGARRYLEEQVARNPHPNVIVALANAARDTGRLDEALALLERLARETEDPRFAEAAAGIREAKAAGSRP